MGRITRPANDALRFVLRGLEAAGPDDVMPSLLEALRPSIGATAVRLLIPDLQERVLERWPASADDRASGEVVPIEGSEHGDSYRTGTTVRTLVDGVPAILTPITARKEREGVLEVLLDGAPTDEDEAVIETVGMFLGYFINAADRWTDAFHLARRAREMALAAEIQWSIVPLGAFSTRGIAIAGALEPAYDVGGDSFDYTCGARLLTAGIFDAMGHGLTAARLSSLSLAAIRNVRRGGGDIEEQARSVHSLLRDGFETEGYMTGLFVEIDLREPGRSRILAAGHPPPLLQHGNATPQEVHIGSHIPMGMPFDDGFAAEELGLGPGDRLVLYTDGVVDTRPDEGTRFGVEGLMVALMENRTLSPRETARKVIGTVRDHRRGHLVDDATILVVDILDEEVDPIDDRRDVSASTG